MGSAQPTAQIETLYSVQASYTVYGAGNAVTCDDIINIPLCHTLFRQTVIDKCSYNIIPVVEIVSTRPLSFTLITNEGVTLEPLYASSRYPNNPYNNTPYYFVLPPGTTGIKHVIVDSKYNLRAALEFGIMPPPYNYDNALFGVITSVVGDNIDRIAKLEGKRVFVRQVDLKCYSSFFQLFGFNEQNGLLGWESMFDNTGNELTLTYGNPGAPNIIFAGVDVTDCKKLALSYNKASSLFTLYAITEGVTGKISGQRFLASGIAKITDSPQGLHLLIDGYEKSNIVSKGSGFVCYVN